MKKTIIGITLAALLGGVLLSAGIASAHGDNRDFMGFRGEGFFKDLELTDSQKGQLWDLMREQGRKGFKEMRGLRGDMRELDENSSKEEVEQVKKQLSDGIYQGMKKGYEMGKILTPEQKEQLKGKWGERKVRFEDRREGARKRYNQRLIDELDLTPDQQKKLDDMKFGPAERGIMAFCAEELELTDDQVEKIEGIMEKYRPEEGRGFRNFRGEGKEMFGLFSAESFDEARAREMADDQADKMVEGIMNMNKMKAEILNVLEDDQKEEFEKMMEHHFGHGHPGRDHRWR